MLQHISKIRTVYIVCLSNIDNKCVKNMKLIKMKLIKFFKNDKQ